MTSAAAAAPRDLRGLGGAAPSPTETWTRVQQVHDGVRRRLDAALRGQHGLSLAELTLLRLLTGADGNPTSVGRLAEAVGSSAAGVGSALARLAEAGLVTRERGAGDRRTTCARITDVGRERVAAAGRTHDDLLAHLLGPLADDAAVVTDALARAAAAARPPR